MGGRGPHFAGWEVYHLKGLPGRARTRSTPPRRAGGSARSCSARTTAARPGNRWGTTSSTRARQAPTCGTTARRGPGSSPAYGTSNPLWTTRTPSTPAPRTRPCSAPPTPARHGPELIGLRGHSSGPSWQPGAGGLCLHTIIVNPDDQSKMVVAISAAGVFRSDDAGQNWRPANKGLCSEGNIPEAEAEVGHCVHHVAMHPSRPDVLFMQKHWDVMRSDDGGNSWQDVGEGLPCDFGFCIDVHAHEPDTIFVVPIKSDSVHYPPDGKLRVYKSRTGGHEWEPMTKGLPQKNCYVNVYRDAMSVDSLEPCGVYFGTTGGQVYASADGGESWARSGTGPAGRPVRGSPDAAVSYARQP